MARENINSPGQITRPLYKAAIRPSNEFTYGWYEFASNVVIKDFGHHGCFPRWYQRSRVWRLAGCPGRG
jgi:hypothetical protein